MLSGGSQGELKEEKTYVKCTWIPYPGNSHGSEQFALYNGGRDLELPQGGTVRCKGINGRQPLDFFDKPFIGREIADVNLDPFDSISSRFNLLKRVDQIWAYLVAASYNFEFSSTATSCYGINRDQSSIGQESDIKSLNEKIRLFENDEKRDSDAVVLFGISRGTAAVMNALAISNDKQDGAYSKVKLVVLEGAIDSIENIKLNIKNRVKRFLKSENLTNAVTYLAEQGYFRFRYGAYHKEGPSPLELVDKFPKNIPYLFITSEADTLVPCENTKRIAQALADRGENEVFLLVLKNSTHPSYMFDTDEDRANYQNFVHAGLEYAGLEHNSKWAKAGKDLLEACRLQKTPMLARRMSWPHCH